MSKVVEIYSDQFNMIGGGGQYRALMIAKGLSKLGYKVLLITPKFKATYYELEHNYMKYFIFHKKDDILNSFFGYIKNGIILPYLSYSKNPAIVILPSPIFRGNVAFTKMIKKATVIFDLGDIWYKADDPYLYKLISLHYFNLLIKYVNFVILPTSLMKSFFDKAFKQYQSKFIHIPSSIDTSLIRPLQKAENPTIVYIGSLNFGRGIELLPYIVHKCIRTIKDCKLIVAGSGNAETWLKHEVNSLGIQEFVEFLGNVDFMKLTNKCGHGWIGLSLYPGPSIYPVDILKALTYISMGMPVITTTYIEEVKDVAIMVPFNVQRIADAIIQLIKSGNIREELSKKAREIAIRKYDIRVIAYKYHQLLSQSI